MGCKKLYFKIVKNEGPIAQRQSYRLITGRSLVRTQVGPPGCSG